MGSYILLEEKIKHIPHYPGIYIFKDSRGKALYIGKADDLNARVRHYFSQTHLRRLSVMLSKASDIHFITTSDEREALLLENAFIKQYRPNYNVRLRDDKEYPFVCITDDEFPRVGIGRRKKLPKGEFFGPYPCVGSLRKAMSFIRKIITYRTCVKLPSRHCIYYPLKLCPAPCEGKISKEEYLKHIKNLKLLLQGKRSDVIKGLYSDMKKLSLEQRFEDAARVRDRIYLLEKTTGKAITFCGSKAGEVLAMVLDIGKDVRIIDGIDISNISGMYPVGSVVRFVDGKPFKSEYRRYRILLPSKDDVKMLCEIVSRRYRKLLGEKKQLPDMILVDGGVAQTIATKKILGLIGANIPVVGLAKKQEWLFLPGKTEPIILPPTSSALQVLQRVRDEAHRFATFYHKKIRDKSAVRSLLDDVYGIGIKRKKRLILEFGSVEGIVKSEPSYIAKIAGCSVDTAKKWIEQLKHSSG